MATHDALLLARIQFGFTVAFPIILPAITIGLASYLAVLEGCWLRTQRTLFRELYLFWSKVLAVNFGMGVVPPRDDVLRDGRIRPGHRCPVSVLPRPDRLRRDDEHR